MNLKTTIVMIACLFIGKHFNVYAGVFCISTYSTCDTSKLHIYNFNKGTLEDFNQSTNAPNDILVACEGSSVLLSAPSSQSQAQYKWIGPNGFTAYSAEVLIDQISNQHRGYYYVEVLENGKLTKGQIKLTVRQKPASDLAQTVFSSKNNLRLSTKDLGKDAIYTWLTVEDKPIAYSREVFLSPHPVGRYKYKLAIEKNGCLSTDTFDIIVD